MDDIAIPLLAADAAPEHAIVDTPEEKRRRLIMKSRDSALPSPPLPLQPDQPPVVVGPHWKGWEQQMFAALNNRSRYLKVHNKFTWWLSRAAPLEETFPYTVECSQSLLDLARERWCG